MPATTKKHPAKTPTTRELVASKQQAAAKTLAAIAKDVPLPTPAVTVPAVRSSEEYRDHYLNEIAPSGIVGRMIKFSKEATFITTDDDTEVSADAEFVALCGETLVGFVKFNGEGEPPDKIMGLLYDGFVMPMREKLGDLDEGAWEIGLDGEPADPWQHQMYLVLQHVETLELFTFVTSSKTGRRAVGNLLRHYNRMLRTHPDELPVVRLRTGGFQHKDARVGFVSVPVFVVCGRRPADSAVKPDTSLAAFIEDELPPHCK